MAITVLYTQDEAGHTVVPYNELSKEIIIGYLQQEARRNEVVLPNWTQKLLPSIKGVRFTDDVTAYLESFDDERNVLVFWDADMAGLDIPCYVSCTVPGPIESPVHAPLFEPSNYQFRSDELTGGIIFTEWLLEEQEVDFEVHWDE